MQLQWKKCQGDVWCSFNKLDLQQVTEYGVYVIWHSGAAPNVVYVGQGKIAGRIADRRVDPKITRHANKGDLFVTWATVSDYQCDGVERYLVLGKKSLNFMKNLEKIAFFTCEDFRHKV